MGPWDAGISSNVVAGVRRSLSARAVPRVAALRSRRGRADAAAANPCANPTVTNFLAADATHAGVIRPLLLRRHGAPVTYFECIGDRAQQLGAGSQSDAAGTPTLLRDATTWSCDRLTRRFVSTAPKPDGTLGVGTYSVRTMSCAQRFSFDVPRARAARRAAARARHRPLGDRRHSSALCVTAPGQRRACRTLAFARAVAVVSRRVRVRAAGSWRIELRAREHRVRTKVAVGVGREGGGPGGRRSCWRPATR